MKSKFASIGYFITLFLVSIMVGLILNTISENGRTKDKKEVKKALHSFATNSYRLGYMMACEDNKIKCNQKQYEEAVEEFKNNLDK